jgi:hypothetical protein
VHGGIPLFVDAFAAAETLCATHPVDFARLVTTPITFHCINDARDFHYSRPTITLDSAVSCDGRRSGTEPRVMAGSWNPPFPGPLPRDTLNEFYDALGHFARVVEESRVLTEAPSKFRVARPILTVTHQCGIMALTDKLPVSHVLVWWEYHRLFGRRYDTFHLCLSVYTV